MPVPDSIPICYKVKGLYYGCAIVSDYFRKRPPPAHNVHKNEKGIACPCLEWSIFHLTMLCRNSLLGLNNIPPVHSITIISRCAL